MSYVTNTQSAPVGDLAYLTNQIAGIPLNNQLSALFMHPKNVDYIANAIAHKLECWTGLKWNVPANEELQITMERVLSDNYAHWVQSPIDGNRLLSQYVIDSEAYLQYTSYKRHQLFNKFFIEERRERVSSRPEFVRVTKGEALIDTSAKYSLVSPWRKQYPGFMKAFSNPEFNKKLDGDWKAKEIGQKEGFSCAELNLRYS